MKIALLNLPVDSNYGGMLQRFALMKVLQDMGHELVHLNLRFPINVGSPKHKIVRCLKRLVKRWQGNYYGTIRPEYWAKKQYDDECRVTDKFYNKYIRHTSYITSKTQLAKRCRNVDVLLIGSDQVWRKEYEGQYGIGTYFGNFMPESSSVKKVVYGASFGVSEDMLSVHDKEYLKPWYQSFSSVSVREDSGIQLLRDYGWTIPKAVQVLDPTLLLSKNDYSQLIDVAETSPLEGNMLCYILDMTPDKKEVVSKLSESKNLKPFFLSIDGKTSVEQWLRSFRDAEYIVTDSYHGLVFSIIMEKPVHLFMNKSRGNARFDSILKLCGINDVEGFFEGIAKIQNFNGIRKLSLNFINQSLIC